MTTRQLTDLLKEAFQKWSDDNAARISAALAFYTMLSLAPVLVLAVALASLFLGEQSTREALMRDIHGSLGAEGADFIKGILEGQALNRSGVWPTIISIGVMLMGASALFLQLRESVISIWGRDEDAKKGFVVLLVQRAIAGVMVLIFGMVLLAWLGVEAMLTFSSDKADLRNSLGGLWPLISLLISISFWTIVFSLAFRYLPPAKLKFTDVWLAGALTAVGFAVGKFGLGLYFSLAKVSAAYGSAGALVIILLWIFYNAQIFFFGLEFTQVYAKCMGSGQAKEAAHHAEKVRGIEESKDLEIARHQGAQ
ncbi:MAG TPA: YihY/virulence factor BrkB family protein [Fimbriimonadaceae bacterium]|nr:YihY/virulence factor BrkB family protein [Fimbriimonadaceae bacterium]